MNLFLLDATIIITINLISSLKRQFLFHFKAEALLEQLMTEETFNEMDPLKPIQPIVTNKFTSFNIHYMNFASKETTFFVSLILWLL